MKNIAILFFSFFLVSQVSSQEVLSKSDLKDLLKRFDYHGQTILKSFKKIKLKDIKSFERVTDNPEDIKALEDFRKEQEQSEDVEAFWKKKYDVYSGELESVNPTTGGPYSNKFYYFKTRKEGKNPLIFIFPVIMGITPVEKYMASYLAKKGNNVIIARLSEDVSDVRRPIDDIDGFLIRSTVSSRVLYDMAMEFPEVDSKRVGAIGSSLGGIRLLVLMGVDHRFKYGVTYVAGGNVPDILTHSEVEEIDAYRNHKMNELGLNSSIEYKRSLQKVVSIDPIYFTSRINKDNLKMTISKKDKGVPTRNQLEIWNRLGKPNVSFLSRNHVMSVITSFLRRKSILNFFNKKWEEDAKTEKAISQVD